MSEKMDNSSVIFRNLRKKEEEKHIESMEHLHRFLFSKFTQYDD